MESLPVFNSESLRMARERLKAMKRTSLAQRDDRYRGWLDEAAAWLDAGVYGRCSVCSRALDAVHIATRPEVKTCSECRMGAKKADRQWLCIPYRPGRTLQGQAKSHAKVCEPLWSTLEPNDKTIEPFLRAAALWRSEPRLGDERASGAPDALSPGPEGPPKI